MANYESIQLIDYNKEDKIYTFNKEGLQRIIEENEVQDLPVSVISVAGLFRKGKSFLLNFFLRYLYAEDRKNWLSDSSESLKGFDWRGGNVRNTEGIHVWSKIFKLQTADGNQVAVMLMDTQGTFDGKSSNKTGTIIFALSALVSSVQIYNLSSQINENDLENLLLATQYASFSQEESEHKAFQSLIFLIRDWQFYQECPYGEKGGKMLLDEFLEITPDQEANLTKVRNNIRSTFEKLSCFLLPYPGNIVARGMDFTGDIKDIDDKFITHIRTFVASVLSPENLVLKKDSDLDLKCSEFLVLFDTYLKHYNSDELPDERSKSEAAAEVYCAPLLERCLSNYKTDLEKKMIQKHGEEIENWTFDVFAEAHEQILTEVISKFNKAKRFSKKIVSSKVTILSARMQQSFAACNESRSERYTSTAATYYNALASGYVKEYNSIMIAILEKNEDEIEQFTPTAHEKAHEKCKRIVIEKFGEKRFCEYDATECFEKVIQEFDDSFVINESRLKPKFESAVRSHYNQHLETCLEEYKKKMCKLMEGTPLETDEFAREHEQYKSVATDEFNKAKCHDMNFQSQYRKKLQEKIEALFIIHDKQRVYKIEQEKEKLRRETEAKEAAAAHEQEMKRLQLEAEEHERKLQAEEERQRIKNEERFQRELKQEKERLERQIEERRQEAARALQREEARRQQEMEEAERELEKLKRRKDDICTIT